MVRRHMRVSPEFLNLRDLIKRELKDEKLSDREFTQDISKFIVDEDLLPIMVRRARRNIKKKRRGLFE